MEVHIHGNHYGDVVETKVVQAVPDNARPSAAVAKDENEATDATPTTVVSTEMLYAEFDTDRARALFARVIRRGWLDERLQPLGLSGTQKAILAYNLAGALSVANVWQTFGRLWGMPSETLRKYYARGMNQKAGGDFLGEMGNLLDAVE